MSEKAFKVYHLGFLWLIRRVYGLTQPNDVSIESQGCCEEERGIRMSFYVAAQGEGSFTVEKCISCQDSAIKNLKRA